MSIRDRLSSARDESRSLYAIFTGFVGAASIISLIKRALNVGLAGVFEEYLGWYLKIARLLTDPIVYFTPFPVPDWYRDLFLLSFFCVLLWRRAVERVLELRPASTTEMTIRYLKRFGLAFLYSIPLLGLTALVSPVLGFLFPQLTTKRAPSEEATILLQHVIRLYLTVLVVAAVTSVAFFAINSVL